MSETIKPGADEVGAGEGEGGVQQAPSVPEEVLADLYSEITDPDPDAHFRREGRGLGLIPGEKPDKG